MQLDAILFLTNQIATNGIDLKMNIIKGITNLDDVDIAYLAAYIV